MHFLVQKLSAHIFINIYSSKLSCKHTITKTESNPLSHQWTPIWNLFNSYFPGQPR